LLLSALKPPVLVSGSLSRKHEHHKLVLQFVALLVSNFRHAIINHDREAGQYNLNRKRRDAVGAVTTNAGKIGETTTQVTRAAST
jgi:hypothetical protein